MTHSLLRSSAGVVSETVSSKCNAAGSVIVWACLPCGLWGFGLCQQNIDGVLSWCALLCRLLSCLLMLRSPSL